MSQTNQTIHPASPQTATRLDVDDTTYSDLSLFSHEEEYSVFHKLDFTRTRGGHDQLLDFFNQPFGDRPRIIETQQIISLIGKNIASWPLSISNGTVMVIDRFFETAVDDIPSSHNLPGAIAYKLFHAPDYSLVRYTVGHFADFIRGMQTMIGLLSGPDTPKKLESLLYRAQRIMDHEILHSLAKTTPGLKLNPVQVIHYGHYLRYQFKTQAFDLIDIYNRLDAWYSMAIAVDKYKLCTPEVLDQPDPYLEAESLYHLLLPSPVSYTIGLNRDSNFLFLTGANMAGKSTFIRSVGVAVFLAHLGMGVPAASMRLSIFDGILSNINVMDNISKGESYFFNEVQRIRDTLIKISGKKKWLVLIDELFKGTNMQDAMKCSTTVIQGLVKIRSSLFILSTHLYEIGEDLRQYPNITFKYFETSVQDDQLAFSYQLKDGISNDRLGYLILKREKVVDMLERL